MTILAKTRPRGFINWTPQPETETLLSAVRIILEHYVPTYGPMTIRQVFYRLVATTAALVDPYPKTERGYKTLRSISARRVDPVLSGSTRSRRR